MGSTVRHAYGLIHCMHHFLSVCAPDATQYPILMVYVSNNLVTTRLYKLVYTITHVHVLESVHVCLHNYVHVQLCVKARYNFSQFDAIDCCKMIEFTWYPGGASQPKNEVACSKKKKKIWKDSYCVDFHLGIPTLPAPIPLLFEQLHTFFVSIVRSYW